MPIRESFAPFGKDDACERFGKSPDTGPPPVNEGSYGQFLEFISLFGQYFSHFLAVK